MRLLVFVCALLAAEAAKLPGYPSQKPSLETLSTSDVSEPIESPLSVNFNEDNTLAPVLKPSSFPISQSIILSNQHSTSGYPTDGPVHPSFDSSKKNSAHVTSAAEPAQPSFDASNQRVAPGLSTVGPVHPSFDKSDRLSEPSHTSDVSVQPSFDLSKKYSGPDLSPTSPIQHSFDASNRHLTPVFSDIGSEQPSVITSSRHQEANHHADGLIQPSIHTSNQHSAPGILTDVSTQFSSKSPISEDSHQLGLSLRNPAGHDSLKSSEQDGSGSTCPNGQILHVDGNCITPEITRNMFVYSAPAIQPKAIKPPKNLPMPKIEHNIVFIRIEDLNQGLEPVIVPPPQKKHIIYVLNEESEQQGPRLIEITTPPPKNPEVYFVNYADGQTPTLPDGIDFEAALNSAIHAEGILISGGFADSDDHGGDIEKLVADPIIGNAGETSVVSAAISADQRDNEFPAGSGNDIRIPLQHNVEAGVNSVANNVQIPSGIVGVARPQRLYATP